MFDAGFTYAYRCLQNNGVANFFLFSKYLVSARSHENNYSEQICKFLLLIILFQNLKRDTYIFNKENSSAGDDYDKPQLIKMTITEKNIFL